MDTIKNIFVGIIIASLTIMCSYTNAQELVTFNTKQISSRPEILTYKVENKKWGKGLYQVSLFKANDTIEVFTNIILGNFMKLVWGQMTTEMNAIQSTSKIIISKQIMMDTKCSYKSGGLNIVTHMKPYNKIVKNDLMFDTHIIDFSQVSILLRTLSLKVGKQYSFNSINPEKNKLYPLTIIVLSEESVQNIYCFKVELNTFEGQAFYWIEKESNYRVIRIEQPKDHQVTELILADTFD